MPSFNEDRNTSYDHIHKKIKFINGENFLVYNVFCECIILKNGSAFKSVYSELNLARVRAEVDLKF